MSFSPSFTMTRAGALGAIVEGLDLGKPLPEETFDALRHALAANEVLFFPDQDLGGDEQLALARRFGEPSLYPIEKLFGADAPGFQVIVDDEENPPEVDLWHTDVTWLERPPALAILAALEMPAWGGDTMWASTTAAYEALSPAMQKLLDGLECAHSCHGTSSRSPNERAESKGSAIGSRAPTPRSTSPSCAPIRRRASEVSTSPTGA